MLVVGCCRIPDLATGMAHAGGNKLPFMCKRYSSLLARISGGVEVIVVGRRDCRGGSKFRWLGFRQEDGEAGGNPG